MRSPAGQKKDCFLAKGVGCRYPVCPVVIRKYRPVRQYDRLARRNYGLDSPASGSGAVNLSVLSGGRAIVQVNQKKE